MAHKRKTNYNKTKLDSMLEYLEIEQGSGRDEKMNKREIKQFLDKIMLRYEQLIIDDIMLEINQSYPNNEDTEDDAPDLDDKFDKIPPPNIPQYIDDNTNDAFNQKIESFLMWLSYMVYSNKYKIDVLVDDDKIQINLIKPNIDDKK